MVIILIPTTYYTTTYLLTVNTYLKKIIVLWYRLLDAVTDITHGML